MASAKQLMASVKQITLYSGSYSPFAHRARLALDEVGVPYTLYEFATRGKPEWYIKNVNPLGRIPAISWGGPAVPPEEPSPESNKIVESLAILEFLADAFPEAKLLPADPVLRAKARTFILISENYVNDPFRAAFFMGQSADPLLDTVGQLQSMLPSTGFVVGDWSIADIAIAPLAARLVLSVEHGLGNFAAEERKKIQDALGGERLGRFRQYVEDIKARPSFQKSWDEARELETLRNHPGFQKFRKPEPDAPKS